MRVTNLVTAAAYFHATRQLQRHRPDRAHFEAWQNAKLQRWIDRDLRRVPYYRGVAPGTALQALPWMDKATLMDNFHALNRAGLTADEGWTLFSGERRKGKYHVGASTGTSGNRGLFVISDRERYAWLGAMLGKLLPDVWRRRERIAVILPLHTRLYDAANDTGRLQLRFFDLTKGIEAWSGELQGFRPSLLVAPPRVLRWLAEHHPKSINPQRVFAGAEVLDPIDRAVIDRVWPGRLGQIYMATEGLLATTCAQGTLHLAEDLMHFELEPVGRGGLVSPIVSDFRRRTQIMCRYRMNDLIRLSDAPCACGSPLRAVSEIVGRKDDCFEFSRGNSQVLVTPDVLRNTILDSDRSITDFRLTRSSPQRVDLQLSPQAGPGALGSAVHALQSAFEGLGVSVCVTGQIVAMEDANGPKLRRVRDLCTAA